MVTGYRFTEDEFVFLAYFYQCMTVPAWFLCEPEQIDSEKALRTLERKGMLLKNGGKYGEWFYLLMVQEMEESGRIPMLMTAVIGNLTLCVN